MGAAEAEIARRLAEGTHGLLAALFDYRSAAAHAHGRGLVGLGPGLTPAGDDYILGVAAGGMLLGSRGCQRRRALLCEVIDANADRTNEISYAAMSHAARGHLRQSILELGRAIGGGDRAEMARRAQRVLGIGATSGTDILSGMLIGLQLHR